MVYYNEAKRYVNNFIQYRNKQFNPIKPDAHIEQMIDVAIKNITDAKSKLAEIKNLDVPTINLITSLRNSIEDINLNIKGQQDFLIIYFSKGKAKRKALFYEKKLLGLLFR